MNQKLLFYTLVMFVFLFGALSFGFLTGLIDQKELASRIEAEREQGRLVASTCKKFLEGERFQMESSTNAKIRNFLRECKEIGDLQN